MSALPNGPAGLYWSSFDSDKKPMRKLLAFLTIVLLVGGGGLWARPDAGLAYWKQINAFVKHRIVTELATLDQIRSGELKLGVAPPESRQVGTPSIRLTPDPAKISKPKPKIPAAAPPDKFMPAAVRSVPPPVAPQLVTPPHVPGASPELALGQILKHEVREDQTKEETFWTEERIQEALENGAPKSKNSVCLMFCDKKNTIIEINTP